MSAETDQLKKENAELRAENKQLRAEVRQFAWLQLAQIKAGAKSPPAATSSAAGRYDPTKAPR